MPNIATQTVVVLVVLAVSLSAASLPAARAAAESGAESVSRRLEVAEFQLRSGRWQDAVDILAPLAEETDAPASVFRGLGEAYLNLGRRDDAVRALTEAQRRGDARARTLLIGLLGDERSTWPQAIELLQQQVKADPADIDARRRLGELLVYEHRVADAVPVLRDVVAARPDDAPALLLYARTLAWTGDFAAAAPAFDRALAAGAALQPEDTRLLAQAKEAVGDTQAANAQYRAFVQAQPNDPVALAGLARTALATGREAEAEKAIASLRPLAATDPEVALAVARLDVAAGNRDAALPAFAAALAASPDPKLAREYADALVAAGRVDEAIEVVNRHPDDSAAGRAARLRVLAASPQHRQEAQQLALELVREAPGPEVSRAARQVVLASPEGELSLDLVDAVARQYPKDRAVQQKFANMLLARGRKQRAEGVLARLGGGAGRDPELVASLAATQVENGNYSGAKQTLDAAGALVERDARLLSLRAGLRFREGDLPGARADYAAALERAPRRPEARIGLAEVALAEGNVAEAESLLAAPPALPPRQVADLRRRVALQEKLARYRSRPSPELGAELAPLLNAELKRDPDRGDYRLTLAQILEAEGRSGEALEQFRQLQQVEPPLREAWLGPVRLHLARGENDAAEQAFARFQERFPGEEDVAQARLFAGKGERRKRVGDHEGALEAYRKAVEMAPRNVEIRNGIAGVHFHFGNTELALAEFETALEIDPDDAAARRGTVDALTALAGAALERGDREAAGGWLDRALAASGRDAAALGRTAQLALAARDWEVARAAAERLPDGPQASALRARVDLEAELDRNRRDPETVPPRELLDLARRGLELDPDRSDLRLLEAQALERLGDTEAAATAFRAAAESGSTSPDAWAGQIRTLVALGRVRAARAVYDELVVRDAAATAQAELPLALAEVEVAKRGRRYGEALDAARRALVLEPDNVDARLALAGVYAAAGQHADAIAAYEAVLDARPGDVVAREGLAGALFASGDLAAAARIYDDLLAAAPQAATLRASRTSLAVAEAGQALAGGRVAAAERALDRALALDPGNRDALAMKLQVMAGREDFAGARQRIAAVSDRAWRRELESWLAVEEGVARWRADRNALPAAEALRLADQGLRADPGRTDLRLMRAQVLEASGDERAALAAYRDLAGREGAPADAVAGAVRMLVALERFAEAEALLDRVVVLRPEAADSERATLYRARAAALRELGQPTKAFASARDALALQPGDADTLALLGWIYLDTAQPADAAASFAAALDRRPDDVAALQGLATAYEAVGDWDAAERTWVRLASLPAGSFPAEARERIAVQRSFAQVQALRAEGRLAAAADLLERLRATQPRNPDVWAALSEVRNELNQGSLALTAAEQGLQLAPDAGRLHLARVRALVRLGRFDEARRAIAAARGHVADAELARIGGEVERAVARAERERWRREGRLDLAYLALAEEYQLAPNDADVLRAIGYLYLETGQHAEARQFFERAVRLDPQNPAGQMGLAYALRGDGEPGEAIERIESVMAARPSAEAALALAELYHEQGRDRKAAEMLAYARRYGGAPRRVLPPLHLDRARTVAPELRAERGSVLPPLMLPEGALRAVPDRPPAVPVYEEMQRSPEQRSGWYGDDRLGRAAAEPIVLAFADSGVVSDAAPPEAWAFAGPGLEALRRGLADDAAPVQLAQALPSFDRVMQDARGGSREPLYEPAPAAEERIRDEYLPGDGSHEPYGTYGAPAAPGAGRVTVEDYIPAAPQPAGAYRYAIDPTLPAQPRPDAPTPYEQRYRYYEYGDVAPGTAPEPELPSLAPALPPAYGGALYLEREPAGAGLPIREPIAPPTPLDPEARARMTALERKLERAQTMKVSVGFRYDFLDEVSDVIADQFVLWRFPLYLEVPALLGSRLRVTGEPTIIDNGIVTDSGVAGEVAVLGLRLGTDIATASFGAGVTPAGFREGPDVTGFARLTLQLARRLTLTPFFERKPVIESLLSYRGNEFEDIFFGKVMQNRFGGTIGYDTPQEINGVFEVAYSTLDGTRVEDNNKLDAFFSIGRDFDIGSDFVVRPGAQAYFFHYDEDLSSAFPPGLDPVLFPPDEFQPGAGYFSPDSFLEAVLRLDLRGPLLPDTLPGSTFRLGGRVGGQWISGVEAAEFESAEGSRATFGGDGGIEVPFGEVVVFSAGAGFVVADPYNRVYFEMALLFPL